MIIPEYNEAEHVTAGELRGMGAPILDSIPDCAWTPRAELVFGIGEPVQPGDEESRILRLSMTLETGDFHWVKLDLTIDLTERRMDDAEKKLEKKSNDQAQD